MSALANLKQLGDDLWEAADELRANGNFSYNECFLPVLGLIFLPFAEVRFAAKPAQLEAPSPLGGESRVGGPGLQIVGPVPSPGVSRRGSSVDEPAAYHAEGILHLAPNALFDVLWNLPEAKNIGAKIHDAMRVFPEKASPTLVILNMLLPKEENLGRTRDLLLPLLLSGQGKLSGVDKSTANW